MIINKEHKKAIYVLAFCGILGVIFFTCMFFFNISQQENYIGLDAEIIGMKKENKLPNNSNDNPSIVRYVLYEYQYKENTYSIKQRVFTFLGKREGEHKRVYVNPSKPEEVLDTFNMKMYLFLCMFCIVFSIFTCVAIVKMKKEGISKDINLNKIL